VLLYCRCDGMKVVSEGTETVVARACLGMMGALRPACSLVELPPPNCADLLQRCLADTNCRSVFSYYSFLVQLLLGDVRILTARRLIRY